MTQEQLRRLQVIENAVEGKLSVAEPAALLVVSMGQVKRDNARFESKDHGWVRYGQAARVFFPYLSTLRGMFPQQILPRAGRAGSWKSGTLSKNGIEGLSKQNFRHHCLDHAARGHGLV